MQSRPGVADAAGDEQQEEFRAGPGGAVPPDTMPVTRPDQVKKDDLVWVRWGGAWYRSRVLATNNSQAEIHYLGWASGFDTAVPIALLRISADAASNGPAKPAVVGSTPNDSPPRKRTWTDVSGQFKIDAEFVEMQGNIVILKKDDGTNIRLPIDKLSDDDRKIARQLK